MWSRFRIENGWMERRMPWEMEGKKRFMERFIWPRWGPDSGRLSHIPCPRPKLFYITDVDVLAHLASSAGPQGGTCHLPQPVLPSRLLYSLAPPHHCSSSPWIFSSASSSWFPDPSCRPGLCLGLFEISVLQPALAPSSNSHSPDTAFQADSGIWPNFVYRVLLWNSHLIAPNLFFFS